MIEHPRPSSPRRSCCGLFALAALSFSVYGLLAETSPRPATADRLNTTEPAPDDHRSLNWGIYHILHWPDAFAPSLDADIRELRSRPDYVMFFRDLLRPYPRTVCESIIERGATPIISLELVHWGGIHTGRLEAIARGEYDRFFTQYARDVAASGHNVLFRFGFEMNGDWFDWGYQPEPFKAAWRHVRDIFQQEDCKNLVWVWAPNAISVPGAPDNGMEKYWPGDDYVDLIGLDGYNFGDNHSKWHSWTSAEDVFKPALDKIRESGVRHSVLITEFGCADGDAKLRADWIRDAYRFFLSRPEIIGAVWFHFDKRREGESNWRINADPQSLRAWQETFGAVSISGNSP